MTAARTAAIVLAALFAGPFPAAAAAAAAWCFRRAWRNGRRHEKSGLTAAAT